MAGSPEATRSVDSRVLADFAAAVFMAVAVSTEEDSMEVAAAMEAVATDKRRQ